MRKFSDTDLPVSDADAAPSDKNSSSRNTISTYPSCFQAFSNHHNNLSSIEKSISKYRKKHFPCRKTPNYRPKKKQSYFKNTATHHRKLQKK